MVLWVVAFLSVLAMSLSFESSVGFQRTQIYKESAEAYFLARAGMEQARNIILREDVVFSTSGSGEIWPVTAGEQPADAAISRIYLGNGFYEIRYFDEESRLNINDIELATLPVIEKLLYHAAGMGPGGERTALANSILDWIDADSDARPGGAENGYYQNLPEPYSCPNTSIFSLESLTRVKGMTGNILYGYEKEGVAYPGLAFCLGTFGARVNPASAVETLRKALFPQVADDPNIARTTSMPRFIRVVSSGHITDSRVRHSVSGVFRWYRGKLTLVYWDDNYIPVN